MEDERHGNGPAGTSRGSPESSCSKSKNNNNNNQKQKQNHNHCSNITTTTTSNNNKEQDRFLPIANVGRIMKKVIPSNGKISKDAKETVQECVSEFISFVTGEASDKCQREKRKTINGDDIIWAITTLGFEDYVKPLKQYLIKYRELEGEKLHIPKQHRSHEQQQQRLQCHEQEQQNIAYNTVYSSNNLIPQPPSFVATDHQPFPLPFSPNSVPKQVHQQEHIDSMGHW